MGSFNQNVGIGILVFYIVFLVVVLVWWRKGIQERIKKKPELEPGYQFLFKNYLFWLNLPFVFLLLGLISGQIDELRIVLHPEKGNTFLKVWYITMFASNIWILFWIWFKGGADFLTRHPGAFFVHPWWPASTIRWLSLAVSGWTLYGLFLFSAKMFEGVPSHLIHFISNYVPIVNLLGFFTIIYFLGKLGGWDYLAAKFNTNISFDPQPSLPGLGLGISHKIGANSKGLFLKPSPYEMRKCQPMFIPWSDVTTERRKSWGTSIFVLKFGKCPERPYFILKQDIAESLEKDSNGAIKF